MSHPFSGLRVRTLTIYSDESWSRGRHVPRPTWGGGARRLDMTSYGNTLLYIAKSHLLSCLRVRTFTIYSDESWPRDRHVIDFCSFPSREMYICMHIIRVVHSILFCALRFFKYKRVHSSNWHSPFLIQQLYNKKCTLQQHHGAIFPLYLNIYILHTSPHHIHFFTLWDRWILVSWGGSPIRKIAPTRPTLNLFYVGE